MSSLAWKNLEDITSGLAEWKRLGVFSSDRISSDIVPQFKFHQHRVNSPYATRRDYLLYIKWLVELEQTSKKIPHIYNSRLSAGLCMSEITRTMYSYINRNKFDESMYISFIQILQNLNHQHIAEALCRHAIRLTANSVFYKILIKQKLDNSGDILLVRKEIVLALKDYPEDVELWKFFLKFERYVLELNCENNTDGLRKITAEGIKNTKYNISLLLRYQHYLKAFDRRENDFSGLHEFFVIIDNFGSENIEKTLDKFIDKPDHLTFLIFIMLETAINNLLQTKFAIKANEDMEESCDLFEAEYDRDKLCALDGFLDGLELEVYRVQLHSKNACGRSLALFQRDTLGNYRLDKITLNYLSKRGILMFKTPSLNLKYSLKFKDNKSIKQTTSIEFNFINFLIHNEKVLKKSKRFKDVAAIFYIYHKLKFGQNNKEDLQFIIKLLRC